jgi:hypothetical protein
MTDTVRWDWFAAGLLAAAPGFWLGIGASRWATDLTHPIPLPAATEVTGALAMFAVSIPFGAVIAFVPAMIGLRVMQWLGQTSWLARMAQLWVLVGGLAPVAVNALLDGPLGFLLPGLAGAGAVCAFFCRRAVRWPRPEPAGRHAAAQA